MSEIPFVSGPLENWPLAEETLDLVLKDLPGGLGADESFREEVLKHFRRGYARMTKSTKISFRLPDLPVHTADVLLKEVQRLADDLNAQQTQTFNRAVPERLAVSVEVVMLRRMLRSLGKEPPPFRDDLPD